MNRIYLTEEKSSALKIVAAFIAVYIIWGSTYLGIKFAIESIPPFLMASLRFLVSGAILYLLSGRGGGEKLTAAHYRSAAIVGLLLLLGGNGGVVWAEQYVPSGLTALLVSTVPVWVALISWIFPQEKKISVKNIFGVILGFAGLYFLISPGSIIKGNEVDLIGALVLVGASLLWSIGSVYTRHTVLPKSSLLSTSLQMIFGGLGLLAASFIFGEPAGFNPADITTESFLAFLYLIAFGSLIAFSAYIWLLKHAGPSKATTYAYVNPVVAVILGWLIGGEEITLRLVIAAMIIISAVVIILTDFSRFRRKYN